MTSKNKDSKPAEKMRQALACAQARDQWSSGVRQAREQQHQDEVAHLREQLDARVRECDSAQEQLREADRLRQRLADTTAERDRLQAQQAESERLRQRLADITAQRDAACRRVNRLEASLRSARAATSPAAPGQEPTPNTPTAPLTPAKQAGFRATLYRAASTAGVVLSLGVLANAVSYHDAQSTVQPRSPLAESPGSHEAVQADLDVGEVAEVGDETIADDSQTPPPETRRPKTRFARPGRIELNQWGPPLRLEQDRAAANKTFDPLVQRQQRGLLALGFDVGKADGFSGPRTQQALDEFRSLYQSDLETPPTGSALAAIIDNYANLARADARRFGVDQGVVAAIRLSSVRTGIEFSYLMKLAAVESNFEPTSKSPASSATGLYQFTRDTWLNTLKAHGDKYGLDDYVQKIEFRIDRNGYQRPRVRDKAVYKHLMALRKNPRVSAMMAAESVKDNLQRLTRSFDRAPSEADLYLTHFFGTDGAISFLKALDKTPDAPAGDIFPAAAQSNQDIFHPKTCKPRTVDEVYTLFGEKFNNWHFEIAAN